MRPLLQLVTTYPARSLSTTIDGRCYFCGHMAGKPCICATCDNHGKIHEYQHKQKHTTGLEDSAFIKRIWSALWEEDT